MLDESQHPCPAETLQAENERKCPRPGRKHPRRRSADLTLRGEDGRFPAEARGQVGPARSPGRADRVGHGLTTHASRTGWGGGPLLLTVASSSNLPKSSLSSLTSSWAVHWEARLVKPTMSAKRMLQDTGRRLSARPASGQGRPTTACQRPRRAASEPLCPCIPQPGRRAKLSPSHFTGEKTEAGRRRGLPGVPEAGGGHAEPRPPRPPGPTARGRGGGGGRSLDLNALPSRVEWRRGQTTWARLR